MNHRYPSTSNIVVTNGNKISEMFISDEGCRILSNVVNEECKMLQDLKKFLEKRIALDEQYAKNLQELATSVNRYAWPIDLNSVASVTRDITQEWSVLAISMTSNAEQLRRNILDGALRDLIEQKGDSKKFLDSEKRQYDIERQKTERDIADAEKRYLDDARVYVTKNTELTKLQSNIRRGDEAKMKSLKDVVIERRGHVYRAHNDYTLKIREYNFVDLYRIQKTKNLIRYHEETQLYLNNTWLNLVTALIDYSESNYNASRASVETLRAMKNSMNIQFAYDGLCSKHSNTHSSLVPTPIVFNDLLLQTSGLQKLRSNEWIVDTATKQDLKQRVQELTSNINTVTPKPVDSSKDRHQSYPARKDLFIQKQQTEYVRARKRWEENLRYDLKVTLKTVGYRSDDDSNDDSDEDLTDRLEDQAYFHGIMPRNQSISKLSEKGDFLVRINEQGKYVLSILWNDVDDSSRLRDAHFLITERGGMYSLQTGNYTKPSVTELIAYYKRQKLELRDDGTRLIRPISKPDYLINNDEVRVMDILGQGHFGQVARGDYRGQPVAVKILHSSGSYAPQNRKRFIDEALLLQQYKHKNIVKFLGIAAMHDPLMIIMELIEQGSLNNFLKTNEVRISQLVQMCTDIAKGMAYLEKRNVIHRDLATRNCLVDKRNRIKVADFGLSRCLQTDEEYFCHVKEIPVRWWAVEVFQNAPYTTKADVWSYGVTMWEIFSKAETPYPHIPQNHLVIETIKHGDRLRQPDKCPPKIFTIMISCWHVEPADRPTFEKLAELLKKEKPLF